MVNAGTLRWPVCSVDLAPTGARQCRWHSLDHASRCTQQEERKEESRLAISLSQRQQLISGSLCSAKPPPMIARGCWLCHFWRSSSASLCSIRGA